jgi:hypothetical protein
MRGGGIIWMGVYGLHSAHHTHQQDREDTHDPQNKAPVCWHFHHIY